MTGSELAIKSLQRLSALNHAYDDIVEACVVNTAKKNGVINQGVVREATQIVFASLPALNERANGRLAASR